MTTGYIPTIPLLTFTGADGEPAVGYKLYTFTAGTTMPTTTWQDINLTVENTNPIILDAQGQCIMWVGTSSCKLQLTTPIGSVVWTIDNVAGAFPSSGTVSLPEALTNTAGHTGPLIDYDGDVFWLDGTMSFRNRLINGDFAVNQRCVSGTVYLSPGQYGHDRWKAGPSGCTYTFSLVNGKTTITILVGTLTQIIEASNVPPGVNNVVLSWTGTAMGQIGSTPFSSIIALATAPGGINLPISFSNGTLTNAQLELGDNPTPFEDMLTSQEISLCERYYEKTYNYDTAPGAIDPNGSAAMRNTSSGQLFYELPGKFSTKKYRNPTVTYYNPSTGDENSMYCITYQNSWPVLISPTTYGKPSQEAIGGLQAVSVYPPTYPGLFYVHWIAEAEL